MYRRRGLRKGRGRRAGGRFASKSGFRAKFHAAKHFTEVIQLGQLVSPASGSAANGYNLPVQASSLTNFVQLADVFKQYCITGIKLMYLPAYNTYPLVAGTAMIPKIFYAEDKASFSPPLIVNQMLQEDNLKIFDSSKKWTHYIKNPRPWIDVHDGLTNNNTPIVPAARFIQWLTTDDLAGDDTRGSIVNHLHSSILVEPNNSNVAVTTGTVWARVYYAMKDQR